MGMNGVQDSYRVRDKCTTLRSDYQHLDHIFLLLYLQAMLHEMSSVMLQCNNTEKTDRFVQEVMCAPEPMAVLCLEQQFCCDPHNFSVLGTYCLAEFSVTPTVYRHLLLEHHKTKKSPLFVGPVLVHYRNSETTTSFCKPLLA